MITLPVSKMNDFFAAIAGARTLYLPVETGSGQAEFRSWKPGVALSDRTNTARSAKDFFFPQTENIVDFKLKGKNLEVVENRDEREDFVVFGVRACDAASFGILDRVFLSNPVDTFYKSRREHGVVISIACTKPEVTCFCPLFGIDATNPAGRRRGMDRRRLNPFFGEYRKWHGSSRIAETFCARLDGGRRLSGCAAEKRDFESSRQTSVLETKDRKVQGRKSHRAFQFGKVGGTRELLSRMRHVHFRVPDLASAMTLGTSTPDTASDGPAAGTAACSRTLPGWPTAIRV